MAYSSVDAVMTVLHDDSAIDVARIADLLTEVSAEVDAAMLARDYPTVPATGVRDVVLINGIVRDMTAARVWRETYQSDETPSHVDAWEKRFYRFVDGIADGTVKLPDQTTGGGGLRTFKMTFGPTLDADEWQQPDFGA